jgi:hypothetical protein
MESMNPTLGMIALDCLTPRLSGDCRGYCVYRGVTERNEELCFIGTATAANACGFLLAS